MNSGKVLIDLAEFSEKLQQYRQILERLRDEQESYSRIRERLSKLSQRRCSEIKKPTVTSCMCNAGIKIEDSNSFATCRGCERLVCRNEEKRCCEWISAIGIWECSGCRSSRVIQQKAGEWLLNQLTRRLQNPGPINLTNEKLLGLCAADSDDGQSSTSSISSNQKVKVREFIEELLSTMLNGPLDDVSVGQLMKNESYLPICENQKYPDSPSDQHFQLRKLLQRILDEVAKLPELLNQSGHPLRPEEHLPYFSPKKYEQLLATAVLNKVVEDYRNPKNFEHEQKKPEAKEADPAAAAGTTFDINHNKVPGKSLLNKDNLRQMSLNTNAKEAHSSSSLSESDESYLSDYIQKHTVPLPDLSDTTGSGPEDDLISLKSNATDGTWEENWLFKKRKLKTTESAIAMLVPSPTEEVKALIGDKNADEVSDLSEAGSDLEDYDSESNSKDLNLSSKSSAPNTAGTTNTTTTTNEDAVQDSLVSINSIPSCEPILSEAKNSLLLSEQAQEQLAADSSFVHDLISMEPFVGHTETANSRLLGEAEFVNNNNNNVMEAAKVETDDVKLLQERIQNAPKQCDSEGNVLYPVGVARTITSGDHTETAECDRKEIPIDREEPQDQPQDRSALTSPRWILSPADSFVTADESGEYRSMPPSGDTSLVLESHSQQQSLGSLESSTSYEYSRHYNEEGLSSIQRGQESEPVLFDSLENESLEATTPPSPDSLQLTSSSIAVEPSQQESSERSLCEGIIEEKSDAAAVESEDRKQVELLETNNAVTPKRLSLAEIQTFIDEKSQDIYPAEQIVDITPQCLITESNSSPELLEDERSFTAEIGDILFEPSNETITEDSSSATIKSALETMQQLVCEKTPVSGCSLELLEDEEPPTNEMQGSDETEILIDIKKEEQTATPQKPRSSELVETSETQSETKPEVLVDQESEEVAASLLAEKTSDASLQHSPPEGGCDSQSCEQLEADKALTTGTEVSNEPILEKICSTDASQPELLEEDTPFTSEIQQVLYEKEGQEHITEDSSAAIKSALATIQHLVSEKVPEPEFSPELLGNDKPQTDEKLVLVETEPLVDIRKEEQISQEASSSELVETGETQSEITPKVIVDQASQEIAQQSSPLADTIIDALQQHSSAEGGCESQSSEPLETDKALTTGTEVLSEPILEKICSTDASPLELLEEDTSFTSEIQQILYEKEGQEHITEDSSAAIKSALATIQLIASDKAPEPEAFSELLGNEKPQTNEMQASDETEALVDVREKEQIAATEAKSPEMVETGKPLISEVSVDEESQQIAEQIPTITETIIDASQQHSSSEGGCESQPSSEVLEAGAPLIETNSEKSCPTEREVDSSQQRLIAETDLLSELLEEEDRPFTSEIQQILYEKESQNVTEDSSAAAIKSALATIQLIASEKASETETLVDIRENEPTDASLEARSPELLEYERPSTSETEEKTERLVDQTSQKVAEQTPPLTEIITDASVQYSPSEGGCESQPSEPLEADRAQTIGISEKSTSTEQTVDVSQQCLSTASDSQPELLEEERSFTAEIEEILYENESQNVPEDSSATAIKSALATIQLIVSEKASEAEISPKLLENDKSQADEKQTTDETKAEGEQTAASLEAKSPELVETEKPLIGEMQMEEKTEVLETIIDPSLQQSPSEGGCESQFSEPLEANKALTGIEAVNEPLSECLSTASDSQPELLEEEKSFTAEIEEILYEKGSQTVTEDSSSAIKSALATIQHLNSEKASASRLSPELLATDKPQTNEVQASNETNKAEESCTEQQTTSSRKASPELVGIEKHLTGEAQSETKPEDLVDQEGPSLTETTLVTSPQHSPSEGGCDSHSSSKLLETETPLAADSVSKEIGEINSSPVVENQNVEPSVAEQAASTETEMFVEQQNEGLLEKTSPSRLPDSTPELIDVSSLPAAEKEITSEPQISVEQKIEKVEDDQKPQEFCEEPYSREPLVEVAQQHSSEKECESDSSPNLLEALSNQQNEQISAESTSTTETVPALKEELLEADKLSTTKPPILVEQESQDQFFSLTEQIYDASQQLPASQVIVTPETSPEVLKIEKLVTAESSTVNVEQQNEPEGSPPDLPTENQAEEAETSADQQSEEISEESSYSTERIGHPVEQSIVPKEPAESGVCSDHEIQLDESNNPEISKESLSLWLSEESASLDEASVEFPADNLPTDSKEVEAESFAQDTDNTLHASVPDLTESSSPEADTSTEAIAGSIDRLSSPEEFDPIALVAEQPATGPVPISVVTQQMRQYCEELKGILHPQDQSPQNIELTEPISLEEAIEATEFLMPLEAYELKTAEYNQNLRSIDYVEENFPVGEDVECIVTEVQATACDVLNVSPSVEEHSVNEALLVELTATPEPISSQSYERQITSTVEELESNHETPVEAEAAELQPEPNPSDQLNNDELSEYQVEAPELPKDLLADQTPPDQSLDLAFSASQAEPSEIPSRDSSIDTREHEPLSFSSEQQIDDISAPSFNPSDSELSSLSFSMPTVCVLINSNTTTTNLPSADTNNNTASDLHDQPQSFVSETSLEIADHDLPEYPKLSAPAPELNNGHDSNSHEPIDDGRNDEGLIPGSIAEREHLKWQNASPIANNPYSPDILQKRLSDSHQRSSFADFDRLAGKDLSAVTLDSQPAADAALEIEESEESKASCAETNRSLQSVVGGNPTPYTRYGRDYYINDAKRASGSRKHSTNVPPPPAQAPAPTHSTDDEKDQRVSDRIASGSGVTSSDFTPLGSYEQVTPVKRIEDIFLTDDVLEDTLSKKGQNAAAAEEPITPQSLESFSEISTNSRADESLTYSEDSDITRIYEIGTGETKLIPGHTKTSAASSNGQQVVVDNEVVSEEILEIIPQISGHLQTEGIETVRDQRSPSPSIDRSHLIKPRYVKMKQLSPETIRFFSPKKAFTPGGSNLTSTSPLSKSVTDFSDLSNQHSNQYHSTLHIDFPASRSMASHEFTIEKEVMEVLPSVKELAKCYIKPAVSEVPKPILRPRVKLRKDFIRQSSSAINEESQSESPQNGVDNSRRMYQSTGSINAAEEIREIRRLNIEVYNQPNFIPMAPGHSITARSLSKQIREELKTNATDDHKVHGGHASPERPSSPVFEPGHLRSSIQFFENLKNK